MTFQNRSYDSDYGRSPNPMRFCRRCRTYTLGTCARCLAQRKLFPPRLPLQPPTHVYQRAADAPPPDERSADDGRRWTLTHFDHSSAYLAEPDVEQQSA